MYLNDSQEHINLYMQSSKAIKMRKRQDRQKGLAYPLKTDLGRHVLRLSSEGKGKKPNPVLDTLSNSSLKKEGVTARTVCRAGGKD